MLNSFVCKLESIYCHDRLEHKFQELNDKEACSQSNVQLPPPDDESQHKIECQPPVPRLSDSFTHVVSIVSI